MRLTVGNIAKLVAGQLVLLASFATLAAQQPSNAAPSMAVPATADLPSAPQPQLDARIDPPTDSPAGVSSSLQASTSAPQQTTPAAQPPQAQTPAQPPSSQPQETEEERRARILHDEEQQRMLGVIPNFNSVLNGSAPPLTPKQKFHLFFKGAVDPFEFVAAGADAGIEQGQDSYPGYGQGFTGYAKRYGAAFADTTDGNFWGNAVLPSLLHQDPRYFRLGHGKIMHRILYAAATAVICKGDNGHWQPSYSNVLGNFIGGAISNVYYPASDRGATLTAERALTTTAEGAIGSVAVEFYPDVAHWFHNRHSSKAVPPAAAPSTP